MKKIEEQKQIEEQSDDSGQSFFVDNDNLYKVDGEGRILVSNFHLRIKSQAVLQDEEMPGGRYYEILFRSQAKEVTFTIPSDDFLTRRLLSKIAETAGSSAILYGSLKDLQTGTQEFSGVVAEKILRSRGLTSEGYYVAEGMVIEPSGIVATRDHRVVLGQGNYSRNLGFISPDPSKLPELARHIFHDFLELKPHHITYPVLGHVVLAPFTSAIGKSWGKEKPALHCEGPSGSGKTFLASLCMAFFGNFKGRLPSWKATPNSIEVEGFQFRDALYALDDFKASVTPQGTAIRILQGYSGEQGRDRLNPASRLLKTPYIRGLLLSTGEDFVLDTESVTGRVIRLQIEPEKNLEAGRKCQAYSMEYRMFLPLLVRMVIAQPEWRQTAKELIDTSVDSFIKEAQGLSNGLRAVTNWALNALGFWFFLSFLEHLQVIEEELKRDIWKEYDQIVRDHLREQGVALQLENPVEIFFRVITEKMTSGSISIKQWNGEHQKDSRKAIGMVKGRKVMLFPDTVLEVLTGHYRAIGQRLPFSKNSLRDALAREELIDQSKEGRWAIQFRGDGGIRYQGWSFDLETFKTRITV
jgi:hypothetical protein